MNGKRKRRMNTCQKILALLDAEGMSDHTIAQVERYIRRCNFDAARWQDMFEASRKRFATFMISCPPDQRKTVSNFIRHKSRMSMETGIRIGLAAALWNDIEGTEDDSAFPRQFPDSPELPDLLHSQEDGA